MIKTKTGKVSTNRASLLGMEQTQFVKSLLKYREYSKLLNTFVSPLLENLNLDHILHSQFHQAQTVTGRLSSSNPVNFQNIPSRTELGRQIRECFVGRSGKLIVADLNQIELRLLAHFSGDDNLISAFKSNVDVHTKTAQTVFKTETPTKDQRFIGKVVNFSSVYGAGPTTLMNSINSSGLDVKVSYEEAQSFLNDFYGFYSKINQWKNVELAKTKFLSLPYIVTLCDRRIPIRNLKSKDFKELHRAERETISYKIQGSAADIIKLCINKLYERIPDILIVSTVHDEILIDSDSENDLNVVKDVMENCIELSVPLVVDAKLVDNWGEK